MKRFLSILTLGLILGLSSTVNAATNVGATLSVDTQWDQSGSPYIIQAHVLVPPGVTLKIEPGTQVVFQGPATLEVAGDLKVEASAAAPAVFNMTDGGLQSALFIDGGEAFMANSKVIGGVFLVQDATIRMDGSEVTKGSGLYLKGTTVAHLKNNKFYGNATGVVLDGPIEADLQFNTIVQNTYGLYLKDFAKLTFTNNSVHDNDSEVVNNSTKVKLGGNYWGTLSPTVVKNKIKGSVNISPMKDLKDILRSYLRTELPVITQNMSDQAEAEDRRADKAAREALKAFRAKQSQADVLAMEAKNLTLTPQVTLTATPTATLPEPTATATLPAPTPTLAMSGDLSALPGMSSPTVVSTFTLVPTTPAAESAVLGVSAPAVSAPPGPPAADNSGVMSGMPAPPSLPASVPEPPALGQMAVTPIDTSASTPVSLPTSIPTAVPTMAATATPTFVLGGGAMTSDDLASIVATAQAATTSTTQTNSSAPVGSASAVTAPPMNAPASANPPMPQEAAPAPPMPPDLTNNGAPDASAQAAVSPMVPTSVPATVPTAAETSTFTAVFTDTPTYTPTMVWTATATFTYTDTPVPPTATPTTQPPMTSAPAAPAPSSAAPAASLGLGAPAAGAPTLAGSAAAGAPVASGSSVSSNASASTANSQPSAASAGLVPPPPDFGDSSANSGVQAPPVPVNSAPPVVPSQSSSSAGSTIPSATGKPDLDVDGMQAPPMDSGLDFNAQKK